MLYIDSSNGWDDELVFTGESLKDTGRFRGEVIHDKYIDFSQVSLQTLARQHPFFPVFKILDQHLKDQGF